MKLFKRGISTHIQPLTAVFPSQRLVEWDVRYPELWRSVCSWLSPLSIDVKLGFSRCQCYNFDSVSFDNTPAWTVLLGDNSINTDSLHQWFWSLYHVSARQHTGNVIKIRRLVMSGVNIIRISTYRFWNPYQCSTEIWIPIRTCWWRASTTSPSGLFFFQTLTSKSITSLTLSLSVTKKKKTYKTKIKGEEKKS